MYFVQKQHLKKSILIHIEFNGRALPGPYLGRFGVRPAYVGPSRVLGLRPGRASLQPGWVLGHTPSQWAMYCYWVTVNSERYWWLVTVNSERYWWWVGHSEQWTVRGIDGGSHWTLNSERYWWWVTVNTEQWEVLMVGHSDHWTVRGIDGGSHWTLRGIDGWSQWTLNSERNWWWVTVNTEQWELLMVGDIEQWEVMVSTDGSLSFIGIKTKMCNINSD